MQAVLYTETTNHNPNFDYTCRKNARRNNASGNIFRVIMQLNITFEKNYNFLKCVTIS